MKLSVIKHSLKLGWASLVIMNLVTSVYQDNYMPLLITLGLWGIFKIIGEAITAVLFFRAARKMSRPPQEPSQETAFWLKDPDLW